MYGKISGEDISFHCHPKSSFPRRLSPKHLFKIPLKVPPSNFTNLQLKRINPFLRIVTPE